MSNLRQGTPGAARECPHCKQYILSSAQVCPACRHHLRFDSTESMADTGILTPLLVEGIVRHPAGSPALEYSVVVAVRNDRGEEIARKVVSVGAINPHEQRSFTFTIEVAPAPTRGSKAVSKH